MSSCDLIASEIAALRADIAALNNKFAKKTDLQNYATKNEIADLRKYVDTGFQAIINTLERFYETLQNQKVGYQTTGAIDNRIDDLQRQIDRWQGETGRDDWATKLELAEVRRGLEITFEMAETAGELANRSYQELVLVKPVVQDVAFKINELFPRTIKNEFDIRGINSELLVLKAGIAANAKKTVELGLLVAVLSKTVTALGIVTGGLTAASIKMQGDIAYLYSQINNNDISEFIAKLDQTYDIALNAKFKAYEAYNLITGQNEKINNLNKKIDASVSYLFREITTLASYTKDEIRSLTEKTLVALLRLQGQISASQDFILQSVRIAINSVYSRINEVQNSLSVRINYVEVQAAGHIQSLYRLTLQALDLIDEIERSLLPDIRREIDRVESNLNDLKRIVLSLKTGLNRIETRTETRIETRTLQLQPQYSYNIIIQPTVTEKLITRELQPINYYNIVETHTKEIVQVPVNQQIINQITQQTIQQITQRITQQKIEMVRFTTIAVPTGQCTLNADGIWEFIESSIDVQVLLGENGSDALNVLNNFVQMFNLNKELCEQKNKDDDCECYAAVPDSWLIRPEHKRPQMIFQFGEIQGNKLGSPKYEICIPHPKPGYKPNPRKCPLPSYTKGNWEIIYNLNDNSKVTIHSLNELEGKKVLKACLKIINPKQLTQAYLSKNGLVQTKEPLAQILVKPRMAKLFPEGRKNTKPEWVVHFE